MFDWQFWLTPLAGAVIGYITNDIAIRMLFRPRRAIRLRGRTLPFTPGLIPREKARIARSVGRAVGDELLSPETLSAYLTSDDCRKKLNDALDAWVESLLANERTLREELSGRMGEAKFGEARGKLIAGAADKAAEKLASEGLVSDLADALLAKLQDKLRLPFLDRMKPQLEKWIGELMRERAPGVARGFLEQTCDEWLDKTVSDVASGERAHIETLRAWLTERYDPLVRSLVTRALSAVDVARVVEERIDGFSPEQMEELIMSLARKELRAIVWLGAGLGLIMGVATAFLNLL